MCIFHMITSDRSEYKNRSLGDRNSVCPLVCLSVRHTRDGHYYNTTFYNSVLCRHTLDTHGQRGVLHLRPLKLVELKVYLLTSYG